MKRIALFALIAAPWLAAVADDQLTKEIVVDKEIVPVEQNATKIGQTPEITTIEQPATEVNYSDRAVVTPTGNTIPTMLPYGYRTDRAFEGNRGYLDLCMGNWMSIVGSAGYRIVDKPNTRFGVWAQHNSIWGEKTGPGHVGQIKSSESWLGFDLRHLIGRKALNAAVTGRFGRESFIALQNDATPFNNVYELDAVAQYGDRIARNGINWWVGAGYNHFTNRLNKPWDNYNRLTENYFRATGGLSFDWNEGTRVGLDATGELLHQAYPHLHFEPVTIEGSDYSKLVPDGTRVTDNRWQLRLNPYFTRTLDNLLLRVGARIDLSFSDGTVFRIAPDFRLDLRADDRIGLFVTATGGKVMNRNAVIYNTDCHMTPYTPLASTYTPIDATIGAKFGPFSGFRANVYMGYAVTRNSLMPQSINPLFEELATVNLQTPINLHGLYLGGELSYSFRDIATLRAGAQWAKQDGRQGYAGFGFDRPEYIINAGLNVRPLSGLSLDVAFNFRGNRAIHNVSYDANGNEVFTLEKLENAPYLEFGADYQLNKMLGFFLKLNNLLFKEWRLNQYYYACRFHFYVGATLKF